MAVIKYMTVTPLILWGGLACAITLHHINPTEQLRQYSFIAKQFMQILF